MYDLEFKHVKAVNVEALDAMLREALGQLVTGVSVGGGRVAVHLMLNDPALVKRATDIVEAHDPYLLTESQQKQVDERQTLFEMRKRDASLPDPDSISDPVVLALLRKLALLEAEVAALRSGQ